MMLLTTVSAIGELVGKLSLKTAAS